MSDSVENATRKVPFPVDKRSWNPTLIPGPLALISTVDAQGAPNVAPKSWIQMVSFDPPILMFSGSHEGQTEKNIAATGCFIVNLVHGGMAPRVFDCIRSKGAERIARAGFRLTPASKIPAPLVDECKAHLECRLHSTREIGSGFVVFGDIVAASINEELASLPGRDRYPAFDQALFLEDGLYGTLEAARPARAEASSGHCMRFVILLAMARPEIFTEPLIRAHVAHLKRLEEHGKIELGGPFLGNPRGGMLILRGVSEEEARAIAESDPFVSSGAETYLLRKLEVSSRDNNHLGMG